MRLLLGCLAIGLFSAHVVACAWRHCAAESLWLCHVAVAALGVGLLAGWPRLTGVGCLWILLGTPLWGAEILFGTSPTPTSVMTHLGGFAIAWAAARRGGVPARSWMAAWGAGAVVQQVCRWTTPPAANVNAAFEVYPFFRPLTESYAAYLAFLAVAAAVLLWATETAVRRGLCAEASNFWKRATAA